MTHNEAIAALIATNNEVAAFEIAQRDEGMLPGVTLAQWVAFARQCIATRAAVAAVPAYYG